MTFPALDCLAQDRSIRHAAWKVYMHLQRDVLSLKDPREVKVAALAETLHISRPSVIDALNQLVDRGYLVEHSRVSRGVRVLTLAWSLAAKTCD